MANLDLIEKLNLKYKKNAGLDEKGYLQELIEYIKGERIEKAFNSSITLLGEKFKQYFIAGEPAQVCLLFIDVCNFSTRFGNLTGKEIASYFDEYYDLVIPLIYKYGGEIDKIIGDGIVAVFGPPFFDAPFAKCFIGADNCAKEMVYHTLNTRFASKVAFHAGTVNYFCNKNHLYQEFTMIGKPLTELFRLESVAEDNSVNYYERSLVHIYYEQTDGKDWFNLTAHLKTENWKHYSKSVPKLKGVSFGRSFFMEYKPLF